MTVGLLFGRIDGGEQTSTVAADVARERHGIAVSRRSPTDFDRVWRDRLPRSALVHSGAVTC